MLPPPPDALLAGAALFLDFDGTLVPIAPTPDAVVVDDELRALLRSLVERLEGRVALVTGRDLAAIDRFLPGLSLVVAASHGLEQRGVDGIVRRPERPAALDRMAAVMTAFADQHRGVLLEQKPLGAALHYRQAPEHGAAVTALATALAAEHRLVHQPGKMVAELRLPGIDKGGALEAIAAELPFAGHQPVFLGDDDTDEPAMAAAARLGGAGILIGPPRPSAARYGLADVAAARAWLARAVAGA